MASIDEFILADDDDILMSVPLDDITAHETSCFDNESSLVTCAVPEDFQFPFEPYAIQLDFMKKLYQTLECRKVGIFESPTGTGKSLSLICGALKWLKDFEKNHKKELDAKIAAEKTKQQELEKQSASTSKDWITAFVQKQEVKEKTSQLQKEQEKITVWEKKLENLKKNTKPHSALKRKRNQLDEQFEDLFRGSPLCSANALMNTQGGWDTADDGDEFLTDYVSDEESGGADDGEEAELEEEVQVTKIYYCSRTHSQLAQFVREVIRSPYGLDTRVVSLGSRQNMCINEAVNRLNHLSLINDRCLELQRNKTEKKQKLQDGQAKTKRPTGGCPYYKQEVISDLRDNILVDVKDIEDLVTAGQNVKACPYYASRLAVPAAQLVVLPYNTLLHKSTREASNIRIKDNIILIDEAHNLLETIAAIHSVEVTGAQLSCAHCQLSQYLTRYRTRLRADNLKYLNQLLYVLKSSVRYLGGQTEVSAHTQKITNTGVKLQTINNFLYDSGLDVHNLFKIINFCDKSQIARKLHGFVEKYQPSLKPVVEEVKEDKPATWALSRFLKELSDSKLNKPQDNVPIPTRVDDTSTTPGDGGTAVMMSSPLMHILGFLSALTNDDRNGRIVLTKEECFSQCTVKFVLLNPAVHFKEILQEARAVVVAGGTMQPVSEFKDQLFYACDLSPDRIVEFSCGHVILAEQLLPVALAHGPSGVKLDFTYQNREQRDLLDELGRVLLNICNIVPGGVVCFLPSYDYEALVQTHWTTSGHIKKIAAVKKVFREPKKSSQVEGVLHEYSMCIKRHTTTKSSGMTGAILFCVVGGKMSEGINFSDDLGRCVVMVGLPYPNIKSPELKEKMDYLNSKQPKASDGRTAGQVHYENLCMKAVNQSIGRAIRHKNDYAAIMLLDHRYLRTSIYSKLPAWISQYIKPTERFGPAFGLLRQFFQGKRVQVAT